jgi:hypothetical protein
VALGLTLFLGLAGAGVAFAIGGGGGHPAASLSSSSTSSPSTSVPAGKHVHPGPGMRPFFGPGGGGVVHGVYTVPNGSGFRTLAEQTGQVTAVSATSLTVKSADGFAQPYTVEPSTVVDSQAGGISTVAKGDTVRVQATVSGAKQTAINIVDVTKIGSSRQGFGFGSAPAKGSNWPGPPIGDGGPGGPTTSA